MKTMFENYGQAILATLCSICLFIVLFTFTYTLSDYGDVTGLNGMLAAAADVSYDDTPDAISSLGASKDIPFIVKQNLRRHKDYYWYNIVTPSTGYGHMSFSLISLKNIDTDTMYHVGSDAVKAGSDGNTTFNFPDDGLYQMRFRLIDDTDGSEELGVASVYVRKGHDGDGD